MSRLASRSFDLRRILPAVTLADNAPPSTPGAARRGGGRRGASVANRGVAYPGTAAGYSRGDPGVAGRRRGGGACGACGAPCVVDSSAFISFSSAEISGSDDPSAATSGCGVSSLIVVVVSRPAHARERESSRAVRCCWPGPDPRARMRACGAGHATIECRRSPGRARLRSRYTNCGGGKTRTVSRVKTASVMLRTGARPRRTRVWRGRPLPQRRAPG